MNTMAPIAFVERELAAGKNKIVIPKGVYRLEDCGRKFFPLKDLKNVEIDFPARTWSVWRAGDSSCWKTAPAQQSKTPFSTTIRSRTLRDVSLNRMRTETGLSKSSTAIRSKNLTTAISRSGLSRSTAETHMKLSTPCATGTDSPSSLLKTTVTE